MSILKAGRVFSGIQPTGIPHLGNYLGSIKQWVHLQNDIGDDNSMELNATDRVTQNIFCLVDLHSLTIRPDPAVLRENTLKSCAVLLACGLHQSKSTLYLQSMVPQHAQLAWYLSCFASFGYLNRMTQWKSKSKSSPKHGMGSNLGLFSYPVLQAADILLYGAEYVPVGVDQKQHLELTRDIADNFNKFYKKNLLHPPTPLYSTTPRVQDLRDPSKKMSKSSPDELSRIQLNDHPDAIHLKIKRSVTDSIDGIWYDVEARPAVSNLIDIYAAISGKSKEEISKEFGRSSTSHFKSVVAEAITEHVKPIQKEYTLLISDQQHLKRVLKEGAKRCHEIAGANLKKIQDTVHNL
jgi:tryptophanyl-tRNA synthetase